MRLTATLILALAPGVALAGCPTGADMSGGIRLSMADDATETFILREEGVVEGTIDFPSGIGSRFRLVHGLYLTMFEELQDGQPVPDKLTRYVYPMAPQEIPAPVARGGWDVEVALVGAGEPRTEAQRFVFGDPTVFTIGECSYRGFPVTARFGVAPDGYQDRYMLLTDLDVTLLLASGPLDGTPDFMPSYVGIEALR